MNKERKYEFYTLSSSDNVENIRYVGVTCVSLKSRLSQHKYIAKHESKRSTPVSKWIYSMLNKNLDIIITKINECYEDSWESLEKELILKYKNLNYDLLNIDEGGKGVITKEKRENYGIQRSIDAHKTRIVQLSLDNNYIKTFESIKSATESMGLASKSAISNVLKGRSKTSCGYYWVYEKDYLNNNYFLNPPISPKEKGYKFYQYDPDTFKLIKYYESMADVYYEVFGTKNTNTNTLKNAVKNKTTFYGYFWSNENIDDFDDYFDDRFKLLEINSITNEIINKFKNNIDASNYFNLAQSTISNYIRNKTLTKNNTYLIKNKKIKI